MWQAAREGRAKGSLEKALEASYSYSMQRPEIVAGVQRALKSKDLAYIRFEEPAEPLLPRADRGYVASRPQVM
jgi:hypothetical protein